MTGGFGAIGAIIGVFVGGCIVRKLLMASSLSRSVLLGVKVARVRNLVVCSGPSWRWRASAVIAEASLVCVATGSRYPFCSTRVIVHV
jgi:hypothetical protein